jgi:Mg2+ and Co2+ transporter CorA
VNPDDTIPPGALRARPRTGGPGPVRRLLHAVGGVLSEGVLGFLALALVALAIGATVFDLTPEEDRIATAAEWVIVGAFALDLAVQAALAPHPAAYLLSPRGLFDAACVILPVLTLLPTVPEALRNAPALRLLRALRAVALTTRSRVSSGRAARASEEPPPAPPLEVRALTAGAPGRAERIDVGRLEAEMASPEEAFISVSGGAPSEQSRIAERIGLPPGLVAGLLSGAAYPRVDLVPGFVTLLVRTPVLESAPPGGAAGLRRIGTVLVGSGPNLLAFSREHTPLGDALPSRLGATEAAEPFLPRVLLALARELVDRNSAALAAFEEEARAVEDAGGAGDAEGFLERAFRLKRRAGRLEADVRRLHETLRAIAAGKVALEGFAAARLSLFEIVADEAEELCARAAGLGEDVLETIELHLNVVSYQMNRVMRLLAVVTTVAVIPAVVGGLLGMNIAGNPWPATLPQVAFAVVASMALCVYVFAVKGWLR